MKKFLPVFLAILITLSSSICATAVETNKLGDANNDGSVNLIDVIRIQSYVVGSYTGDKNFVSRADVNGDKKVNVVDSIHIMRYIVNLIDRFPADNVTPTKPVVDDDGYYNQIVKP
ncbi:MAG: dockerin type I repeat-containing protein [Acutalibacteraceae bacterium]|nr:dockerin type I repeat-containing protein [Acutalibacteraceae bacterium]